MQLLRQVKTFTEKLYCRDSQVVQDLKPSMIRIMSLAPELASDIDKEKIATDEAK